MSACPFHHLWAAKPAGGPPGEPEEPSKPEAAGQGAAEALAGLALGTQRPPPASSAAQERQVG